MLNKRNIRLTPIHIFYTNFHIFSNCHLYAYILFISLVRINNTLFVFYSNLSSVQFKFNRSISPYIYMYVCISCFKIIACVMTVLKVAGWTKSTCARYKIMAIRKMSKYCHCRCFTVLLSKHIGNHR